MESRGFEPLTYSMPSNCSTVELTPQNSDSPTSFSKNHCFVLDTRLLSDTASIHPEYAHALVQMVGLEPTLPLAGLALHLHLLLGYC